MQKLILFLGLFTTTLFTVPQANAQKGTAGIGLRATPDGGGFNVKAMMGKHLAFEGQLNAGGILSLPGESFTAVALLEGVIPLPDPSWRLFFGGGLHAGVWDNGWWYNERINTWDNGARPIVGIDAIGGVEYLFKKIPLGLSADIKPAINFDNGGPYFFSHNMFGASARFYFR